MPIGELYSNFEKNHSNNEITLSTSVSSRAHLFFYSSVLSFRQRQEFRLSGGKLKIWGKPAAFIEAKYTTKDGEARTSLLHASGWWGIAR